ncbi:MAG: SEL1-like repeat protein [Magnetococcales bacterium]|nr:SEL1-like repeat protein [Magnetococcales bacterium]
MSGKDRETGLGGGAGGNRNTGDDDAVTILGSGLRLVPADEPDKSGIAEEEDAPTVLGLLVTPPPSPVDDEDAPTVLGLPVMPPPSSVDDEDTPTVLSRPVHTGGVRYDLSDSGRGSAPQEEDDAATVMAVVPPAAPTTRPKAVVDEAATVLAVSLPGGGNEATLLATGEATTESEKTSATDDTDGSVLKPAVVEHPADALPIGQMLLWYKIVKVLGQGGFGMTYKAHDTRLDNYVALKEFLPTQLASRRPDKTIQAKSSEAEPLFIKGRQRFLDEARTLAKFKHPSLVRVTTFFEEYNTAYMAMEFEDGESLAALLKAKKTLDEKELLGVMMPLMQGIQVLHEAQYIHRDIKPDNIFIRAKDNTPVLLDFGSARRASGEDGGHMTAMLTPNYAPMEQYFEDASRQGPWTDIYALGAVMYRCISGRKPIGAPQRSNALMRQQPDPLKPALEIGQGHYSEAVLKAIDLALRVIETERPKSIPDWLKAVQSEKGGEDSDLISMLETAAGAKTTPPQRIAVLATGAVAILGAGLFLWNTLAVKLPSPEEVAREKAAVEFKSLQEKSIQGDGQAMLDLAGRYQEGRGVAQDPFQSLEWYTKAAQKGMQEAQYRLGLIYLQGLGTPRSSVKAVEWFQAAAKQGHVESMFQLGKALEMGAGVKVDNKAALDWHQKAAELGHVEAGYRIGVAMEQGQLMPQDLKGAFDRFVKAAEKGVPEAQYRLGSMFRDGRGIEADAANATRYFRRAAAQGHMESQFILAQRLFKGEGGKADHIEAADWLRKAAESGHAEAQFDLGRAYEKGDGVPLDGMAALKWYSTAAEKGFLNAQLMLAGKFLYGDGVPEDHKSAAKWFQKAAEQGNAIAQTNLAKLYRLGLGVDVDYHNALRWFLEAAKQGNAEAQNSLGSMLENGQGVDQDLKSSFMWYQKAADQGESSAMYNLGWMYEEGRGVDRNIQEAAKWYARAASKGHSRAQNSLGWMYEEGRGVRKSQLKAYFWYSLSAVQGDKDALKNLQMLSRQLTKEQIRQVQEEARIWLEKQGSGVEVKLDE